MKVKMIPHDTLEFLGTAMMELPVGFIPLVIEDKPENDNTFVGILPDGEWILYNVFMQSGLSISRHYTNVKIQSIVLSCILDHFNWTSSDLGNLICKAGRTVETYRSNCKLTPKVAYDIYKVLLTNPPKRLKKEDEARRAYIVEPIPHGNGGWMGSKVLGDFATIDDAKNFPIHTKWEPCVDCGCVLNLPMICNSEDPNDSVFIWDEDDHRWVNA